MRIVVVVLPAPFGPRKQTTDLARTWNDKRSRASAESVRPERRFFVRSPTTIMRHAAEGGYPQQTSRKHSSGPGFGRVRAADWTALDDGKPGGGGKRGDATHVPVWTESNPRILEQISIESFYIS